MRDAFRHSKQCVPFIGDGANMLELGQKKPALTEEITVSK
ncbi:hypothetical protein yrohd0001_38210 [Yersinia rohdei ATCC 43380]|nr:hypothetical protein yrohd0001_38210 [Yersinia rohdei ATCC 43380]